MALAYRPGRPASESFEVAEVFGAAGCPLVPDERVTPEKRDREIAEAAFVTPEIYPGSE
jgi:hypothetical protein